MKIQKLHEQALLYSKNYREAERALIGILQQIDERRGYRELGYPSTFRYCVQALGLSENITYGLLSIARKARVVPALRAKVEDQTITLTNARLVAPVLTPENQAEWLSKAEALPRRELEREIALQLPERSVPERVRYAAPERLELRLGISPALHAEFRRAQDLVSQSTGRAATLEDTLAAVLAMFIESRDPVKKAERAKVRAAAKENAFAKENATKQDATKEKAEKVLAQDAFASASAPDPVPASTPVSDSDLEENRANLVPGKGSIRKPLPAALIHALMRRDGGRCVHQAPDGSRCEEKRWLDFHHRVPRGHGGTDSLENIETRCRGHHAMTHGNTSA